MIVEKDLLNQLKFFGLNSYEAKLWTALLTKGVSTAGELSDIANVPRSRSYDVLDSLENKGFIIAKIGKPIKYIAIPPQEVLSRVKRKIQDESEKKVEQIENLKSTDLLKELIILHEQNINFTNPSELSSLIHGRENILTHLNFMFKNANKSIKIMTTPSAFERKITLLKKNFKKLNNNLDIQVVTDLNKIKDRKDVFFTKINLKNNENISSRFCLIDDKEALIMLVDDNTTHPTSDTAIWINSPFFVSSLNNLFETISK